MASSSTKEKKLIVILEKANLDIIKTFSNEYALANCDDHMQIIRKLKKDPAFCRPDILHQCLQILTTSPLSRAGRLDIYVRTKNKELFHVNSQFCIPDAMDEFSKLMVHLLHNLRPIRAKKGSKHLAKLLKNPVTLHLPVGIPKYGTSSKAKKIIRPSELVPSEDSKYEAVAVVIGAMAHDACDPDYVDSTFSISKYPLSAALVCAKITSAFEQAWSIH